MQPNAIATLDDVASDWSIDRLAVEITHRHDEAEHNAREAVRCALRVGELLIAAKGKVPHGEFEAWVSANTPVAVRTAQAYMRLAKRIPELPDAEAQRVADLPLREAIRAITTTPTAPLIDRTPNFDIRMRDSRERGYAQFRKAATGIRKMVRCVDIGAVRGRDIDRARKVLQDALTALDQLVEEHRDAA